MQWFCEFSLHEKQQHELFNFKCGYKIEPRNAWKKYENDYETYELRCYVGQMQLLESSEGVCVAV